MSLEKQEEYKEMPYVVENSKKTFREFEAEGWVLECSFHDRFPDQWNSVVETAQRLERYGHWDLALAYDDTEGGRKDGIRYLYKREKSN